MTISRRQFFAAAAAAVLAKPLTEGKLLLGVPSELWGKPWTKADVIDYGYSEAGHNYRLQHRRYLMTVKKCLEALALFPPQCLMTPEQLAEWRREPPAA